MSRSSQARKQRQAMKSIARGWGQWEEVQLSHETRHQFPFLKHCGAVYANQRYAVELFSCSSEIGGVQQVVVRRHGNLPDEIPWSDLQRIKNEIFGVHHAAVEIYPPAVYAWTTTSNVRVLWILPTNYHLPFGLHLETAWGGKDQLAKEKL